MNKSNYYTYIQDDTGAENCIYENYYLNKSND